MTALSPSADDREHFAGYLPPGSWFALVEPTDIEEEGRHFLERLENPAGRPQRANDAGRRSIAFPRSRWRRSRSDRWKRPAICGSNRSSASAATSPRCATNWMPPAPARRSTSFRRPRPKSSGCSRFSARRGWPRPAGCIFASGICRAGFRLVPERIALVSGGELFHRTDLHRSARRKLGRVIDSFLELREGDYVVHLSHGIGRYRGLKLLEKEGQVEEHLILEFQGETKIYVPASKIELVQKYVGGAKSRPTLAKIGGRSWIRQKEAAEEAVTDLAADMLDMQAARATRPGISFAGDTPWQQEFDASFPYHETRDQLTAIAVDQARHAAAAADGPAALRRRGLRQDRSGDAGGVQGGRRRLPGGGAGADHDPGRAASAHVSRPHGRVSLHDRRPVAVQHAGRSRNASSTAWPSARSTSSSARIGWPSTTCSSTTWGC